MGKRNRPKNYLDTSVKELYNALNIIGIRLQTLEATFSTYIEWMRHEKKFKKYLEKKYKDKTPVQDEEK